MCCLPAVERGSHHQRCVLEDLPAEETQHGASQRELPKPRHGLTLLWTCLVAQSHHPTNRKIYKATFCASVMGQHQISCFYEKEKKGESLNRGNFCFLLMKPMRRQAQKLDSLEWLRNNLEFCRAVLRPLSLLRTQRWLLRSTKYGGFSLTTCRWG